MTGPKQTTIIPAVPGEPITQTMLNQIIDGANQARMVSGDGKIRVSQVGGAVGLSLARQRNQDREFLCQILPWAIGGTLTTGFYYAKVYTQSGVGISASTTSAGIPMMPISVPDVAVAIAVNLAEVNPSTTDTGSLTAAGTPITATRMAVGRSIGYMGGVLLLAVDVGNTGVSPIPGTITASGSITATSWNYTCGGYTGTSYPIVRNGCEPYAGSPGKYGLHVGTDGTLNGGSCVAKPIGVGCEVLLYPDPTTPGGWMFSLGGGAE